MNWGNDTHREMKIRFLLEQYAFLKDPQPVVPYLPDQLDVDISNKCNLKCISCFHSHPEFGSMKNMTFDTLCAVLDQAEGRSSTVTIGNHGEPFIHRDALKFIEEIKRRGFFLNVINNGALLTEERAQALIDLEVDRVSFSIDSVDPEIYPQVRVNGTLEKTLPNILRFLKMNVDQGFRIYTNISTVNTPLALSSKPDIREYFERLPVHVIYTSELLNFQGGLSIDADSKFEKKYKQISDPKDWPVCLNGFDRLLIRPNGEASLCPIDWSKKHVLGNVNDTPYYELWNNEQAQLFRRGLISRDYREIEANGPLCSVCDGKWGIPVEGHNGLILKRVATAYDQSRQELDTEVNTPERYRNLLAELAKWNGKTASAGDKKATHVKQENPS